MQPTPSSILRKRANKENEGGNRDGKKPRPRGRRVSFAPDDELATTHLFSKDNDGKLRLWRQEEDMHEEDMQMTEDLAGRMPLATSQEPNLAVQPALQQQLTGLVLPALSSSNMAGLQLPAQQPQAGVTGLAQHPSLLAMMSPGAMMSPASVSMDLTNNSNTELAQQRAAQQHAAQAPQAAAPAGARERPMPGPAPAFDFTCNITSAVPALSTLVEEDEENGQEASMAGGADDSTPQGAPPAAGAMSHGHALSQQQQQDMTVSMDLTGSMAAGGAAAPPTGPAGALDASGYGFMSPVAARPPLPPAAAAARAGLGMADGALGLGLDMSPTSPFALNAMQQRGHAGQAGEEDASDELKDKWGFTPGADDTLEMSHGRRVMGDTTYNHVYGGGSTMGDITLAMRAEQAAAAAAAGSKPLATSRSAIAATANAAAAAAAAVQGPAPVAVKPATTTGQPPQQGIGMNRALGAAARGLLGLGSAAAQTPGQAGQTEMTINLLADDQPAGLWRQPFAALPSMTGHASVASSKPAPSHAPQPPGPARGGLEGGPSAGLLEGHSLLGRPLGAALPGPGAGAAVSGGGATVTRTVHNFTAQLLADGTTTAGPLGAFMQHLQQEARAGAGVGPAAGGQAPPGAQLQPPDQAAGRGREYPRDDMTTASSSLLPPQLASQPGDMAVNKDATASSLDFSLAAQQFLAAAGASGRLLADNTLDDFDMPPELNSNPAGQAAGPAKALGAKPHSAPRQQQLPAPGSQAAPMEATTPQQQRAASAAATPHGLARASGTTPRRDNTTNILRQAIAAAAMQPLPPDAGAGAGLADEQQEEEGRAGSGRLAIRGSGAALFAGHGAGMAMEDVLLTGPPPTGADVAPISFQEFLGLVEIRFLDDMRRRTSFLPPCDLALLHGGGGSGKGRAAGTGPLSYADALDALHVTGAHARLQSSAIQELADKVEVLQSRTTQAEVALARNNPMVFQEAQVAGPDALEDVRDRMKLLKRVCRQRTLLAWKKQRIAREQALATTHHEALTALQEEAGQLQAALEQALALEQSLEASQTDATQHTQQLQAEAKAHQAAREHDTLMNLRLAEMAAANEQRRQQLGEVAEQQEVLRCEFESALQRKASLSQQLKALQGQGVLAATPERAATPSGASGRGALTAAEAHLAELQASLEALLTAQGLQLDLQHTRALPAAQPPHATSWGVVVQGQVRVTATAITPAAGTSGSQPTTALPGSQQEPSEADSSGCQWHVVVDTTQAARPLAQQLLHTCLGPDWCDVQLSSSPQLLQHMRRLLAHLHGLCQLVEQLTDAQLECRSLTAITTRPAPAAAATAESLSSAAQGHLLPPQPQQELMLSFVLAPGVGIPRPCKAEVVLPCGLHLLLLPPRSPAAAAALPTASAHVLIPAAHAAAWTPGLAAVVQQQLATARPAWCSELCNAVVKWMRNQLEGACAAAGTDMRVRQAGAAPAAMPMLITNPLFA